MTTIKGTSQAVTRKEHVIEQEAKRVIPVDPFGGILTDGNFTVYIDEASDTVTYIGKAQIGTATSEAKWQIKKIYSSGTDTSITWADGTDEFSKVWDNRSSYSYS